MLALPHRLFEDWFSLWEGLHWVAELQQVARLRLREVLRFREGFERVKRVLGVFFAEAVGYLLARPITRPAGDSPPRRKDLLLRLRFIRNGVKLIGIWHVLEDIDLREELLLKHDGVDIEICLVG